MTRVLTKIISKRFLRDIIRLPSVLYVTSVSPPSSNLLSNMFKSTVFNLKDAEKDQVQEFLNSFDTVLSDCDGNIF